MAPILAIGALLLLRPSEEVISKPIETPPVEQKVVAPVEQPKDTTAADEEAMRLALLGDGKEEPKGVSVLDRPKQVRPQKRRVRPEHEETEEDDGLTNEQREGNDGLSDSAFRATIEGWHAMKSCVATSKSKARAGTNGGALKMSLKIACSGDVLSSRVFEESNEMSKDVARCVERQVRTLKFPSFTYDEPAVVKEAKFVF